MRAEERPGKAVAGMRWRTPSNVGIRHLPATITTTDHGIKINIPAKGNLISKQITNQSIKELFKENTNTWWLRHQLKHDYFSTIGLISE